MTDERLTFSCTPATASHARRLIKTFAEGRMSEPGISELETAVGEALANAVAFGRATEIEIRCTFDDAELVVELSDNGQGFDHPKSIEPDVASLSPARERGFGFPIMRATADELTYSDGGRRITLKKYI